MSQRSSQTVPKLLFLQISTLPSTKLYSSWQLLISIRSASYLHKVVFWSVALRSWAIYSVVVPFSPARLLTSLTSPSLHAVVQCSIKLNLHHNNLLTAQKAITSETRVTGTSETAFSVSTHCISIAGVNINGTFINICSKYSLVWQSRNISFHWSPLHVPFLPLPVYPVLHVQLKPPSMFKQSATLGSSQSSRSSSHSLISSIHTNYYCTS